MRWANCVHCSDVEGLEIFLIKIFLQKRARSDCRNLLAHCPGVCEEGPYYPLLLVRSPPSVFLASALRLWLSGVL